MGTHMKLLKDIKYTSSCWHVEPMLAKTLSPTVSQYICGTKLPRYLLAVQFIADILLHYEKTTKSGKIKKKSQTCRCFYLAI